MDAVLTTDRLEMAKAVRAGLLKTPRELPSRYFYDDLGSQLFDQITHLPEYYPTRAETEILQAHAAEICALAQPSAIVELGSGYCTKTRILIRAGLDLGSLRTFVPLDISPSVIEHSEQALLNDFPELEVKGVVADFETALAHLPPTETKLITFLGSTIGNLDPAARLHFFANVAASLKGADTFLLGVDLVKPEPILHAAYNDSAGVTAAFNLNLLSVLNRDLGADFDLTAFEHVAFYSASDHRIEMHLRSLRRQSVTILSCDLQLDLLDGEMIRSEISTKFSPEMVAAELTRGGLRLTHWFTNPASEFGLALATRAD
jgi:L-histidine N-alpha-methyltransferase